jgi:hypothetical protein
MAEYTPLFSDADAPFTLTLSATVTGGQLVTAAGGVAGSAQVGVVGVAGQDGVSGDKITCWGPGKHRLVASGSIAQGDPLCAGAAGTIRTWVSGTDAVASRIGVALAAATNGQAVSCSIFGV